MKKSILLSVSVFLLSILLAGCGVSKKQHNDLLAHSNDLNARYQQSLLDLVECNARTKSLEEQIEIARATNTDLGKSLQSLQGSLDKSISQGGINISKLVDEINASNKYIQHLVNTKNKSDSLNMLLTNNLTRSLSREELRDVDVQVSKGVVYISLSNNMLYKSGGFEISDAAGETLGKIAKIIQDYHNYDVLIEGNTDNVPIIRENIRNNWDLSTLRSVSVVMELQNKYGIDPKRLTAAGRGEYNPVSDNSTESGKLSNRRTQIIITPKLDQFMELIDQAPESSDTILRQ